MADARADACGIGGSAFGLKEFIDVLMKYNAEALAQTRHYETMRTTLGTLYFGVLGGMLAAYGYFAASGIANDERVDVVILGILLIGVGFMFLRLFARTHGRYRRHAAFAAELGRQVSLLCGHKLVSDSRNAEQAGSLQRDLSLFAMYEAERMKLEQDAAARRRRMLPAGLLTEREVTAFERIVGRVAGLNSWQIWQGICLVSLLPGAWMIIQGLGE